MYMATKRKLEVAFGRDRVPVSAFAAARKAQSQKIQQVESPEGRKHISHPDRNQFEALSQSTVARPDETHVSQPLDLAVTQTDARLSSVPQSRLKAPSSDGTSSEYELVLGANESISFVGEYNLEILSGVVSIYGAVLDRTSGVHQVIATSTHAIPQIVARKTDTEIRISSVRCAVFEALSPLFRGIGSPSGDHRTFLYLEHSSNDPLQRHLQPLETTSSTTKALSQLIAAIESERSQKLILTIGAKSSGKSTFNKQLCNSILTRTAHKRCIFLDLDPGQPEFGPPGQIYLVDICRPVLGPSYSHFAAKHSADYRLLAAHSIAATTFKDDPGYYVSCVKDLFDKQKQHAPTAGGTNDPIVINSCGWVNGLGARVLTDILQFGVTDAVIIDTIDTELLQAAKDNCQCYFVERPQARPAPRTPAELRQMQTMAYFHSVGQTSIKVCEQLSHHKPWNVPYAQSSRSITAITSYGQIVDPLFLAEVLVGSLVAIVSATSPDESFEQAVSDHDPLRRTIARTPEDLPYDRSMRPYDPRRYDYEALALVRSIDVKRKELQLLTPLSETQIAVMTTKRIVLVRGAFDNPDWAYLEDVYADETSRDVDGVRPWVAKREMVGVESAVWRLRHPPTSIKPSINR